MAEMILTVPPEMENYLRERVAAGDFVDPAEYVRDLIRADERSLADLRAAIDQGLASGDSERTVDQIFDEVVIRRRNA